MRQFRAFWGEGYGMKAEAVYSLDWFTIDLGYEPEQIIQLQQLGIGETADFSDLSGEHHVTRIS